MASYELINENDAPEAPKALSKSTQETLAMINALRPGKVAKLPVPTDKSSRGLRSGITRIAKNNGKNVTVWEAENHIYVKLAD